MLSVNCSLHIITVSVGPPCPLTLQPADPSRLPLFLHLDLWDAGADVLAKYDYIKPAMLKNAAVALFCFSVTDRSSWEGLGDLVGEARGPAGLGQGLGMLQRFAAIVFVGCQNWLLNDKAIYQIH